MSPLRMIYLGLALIGTALPLPYFIGFLSENAWDVGAMIDAWYVNAATTGLVWDLTIAAVTLTLWIVVETWTSRNWRGLLAIPAIYLIGVSCGLPLYLFLRSRPVT